jgi:hypothetical protein
MLLLLFELTLYKHSLQRQNSPDDLCVTYNDEYTCRRSGCFYTDSGKCVSFSTPPDFESMPKKVYRKIESNPKNRPVQPRPKYESSTSSKNTENDSYQNSRQETRRQYIKYSIDNTISHIFPNTQFDTVSYPSLAPNSKKDSSSNMCFATYSNDGCPVCHSRDPSIQCGWCQSAGFCAEGSISGASSAECPKRNWIFNQTICNSIMCSLSLTKESCKAPCSWSFVRGKCVMPISLMNTANMLINSVENKLKTSSYSWIYAACGLFVVCVVAAVLGFVYTSKKHVYQTLPAMKPNFNLNEIPNL